ncbi:MAG: hypothetical protein ACREK8_03885, partial [Gemmatimonadales bacterium]
MLASLVATLAHWFAPWQSAYSDSKFLETGITSLHIGATVVGGGIAIAADRDTLRTLHAESQLGPQALDELHATHRPVLIGLAVLFVTGFALALADVNTFAKSPVFLVKLLLVLSLCLNGVFLARTEHALRRRVFSETAWPASPDPTPALWTRLRAASWISII